MPRRPQKAAGGATPVTIMISSILAFGAIAVLADNDPLGH
jgi:hypothetical protein